MRKDSVNGAISEKEAWAWFSKKHKALAQHLRVFEAGCRKRQDQGEFWWELRPCDYYEYFEHTKIIFPDIAKGPRFHLDSEGFYLANTAYCLSIADKYLLGVLNSRLFWFAIGNISIPFGMRAGEYRYRLIYQYMEKVPIRVIDQANARDKALHEQMVTLVDRVLDLTKKKHSGKLAPSELDNLERQIAATDAEIDDSVFKLYEITAIKQRSGARHGGPAGVVSATAIAAPSRRATKRRGLHIGPTRRKTPMSAVGRIRQL